LDVKETSRAAVGDVVNEGRADLTDRAETPSALGDNLLLRDLNRALVENRDVQLVLLLEVVEEPFEAGT
jgi:hypothetical protein